MTDQSAQFQALTALTACFMDTPKGYCPDCHEGGVISEIKKDQTHDFYGNDTGDMMCCPNCTYSEEIEPSVHFDRLEDSPATDW